MKLDTSFEELLCVLYCFLLGLTVGCLFAWCISTASMNQAKRQRWTFHLSASELSTTVAIDVLMNFTFLFESKRIASRHNRNCIYCLRKRLYAFIPDPEPGLMFTLHVNNAIETTGSRRTKTPQNVGNPILFFCSQSTTGRTTHCCLYSELRTFL